MTKLKRKLNEYLSGEKKVPKGKVKFCPLSPCKRQRTPIFQLHKHLQSSLHKLHPNSPSYVRALDKAPRVSLKVLGSYINERKKKGERRGRKKVHRKMTTLAKTKAMRIIAVRSRRNRSCQKLRGPKLWI